MTRPEPRKFTFDQRFDDASQPLAPRAKRYHTTDELESARNEAYEKGRGSLEAIAAQSQGMALGQIAEAAMTALNTLNAMAAEARADAMEVALVAARRIAETALERYPLDMIEQTISECLAAAAHEPRIVLNVPHALVEPLKARIQDLADSAGFAGRIVVTGEARLGAGDCRLDWTDGGAERDAAAIAERVEAVLARFMEADRRRAEDSTGA